MKVVCINAGDIDSDNLTSHTQGIDLVENEIYTVIDSFIEAGYCWYVLEEDTYNTEDDVGGYDSERFASLTQTESAIKETMKILRPKKWYQKIFSIHA